MRFDIATNTWEEIGNSSTFIFNTTSQMTPVPQKKVSNRDQASYSALVKKESMMDTIPQSSCSDIASPSNTNVNQQHLRTNLSRTSIGAARYSGTPSAMLKDVSSFSQIRTNESLLMRR